MPKNEDGEFELILGNRQLLSVFFIVVVLLGVFFTMGYIVGRNSGPLQATDVASAPKETKPMVIDPPTAKQEAKAEPKQEPKSEEKPHETKPQVAELKHEPVKPPEPEPKKQEVAKKAEVAPPPAPPAGGAYLQLAATGQHEADVYVDALKKKGFKAITTAIPEKPGVFRVMVGPLADTAISKTRSDLVAAGFPGDKAIKK